MYRNVFAGACGQTYGCHDIWQMYEAGYAPGSGARTGWKEAMHLPGSRQMSFVKNLFLSLPWQQMENDQTLILNDNPEDQSYMVSSIGPDKDFILFYTPWGKPVQPDLSRLHAERASAYWYNPRSGRSSFIGTYETSSKPVFTPWATGRGSDFVLIVLDENSQFLLPWLTNPPEKSP